MAILEPKKIALLIAVLAGFLTPFDLSAVNIALPTIASEFSIDAVTIELGCIRLSACIRGLFNDRLAESQIFMGGKKSFAAGLNDLYPGLIRHRIFCVTCA